MFYFNLSVPFTEQRPNAHFILDLLLVLSLSGPFFGSYANSRIIGWDIQWQQQPEQQLRLNGVRPLTMLLSNWMPARHKGMY